MISTSLELYEKLVATNKSLERKGATMPYTSLNGHMFSFLDKKGIMHLRLSKEKRELFIKKYNTQLSVQHGKVLQEYVMVPVSMLSDMKTIKKYFDLSYQYIQTLKPKPLK